MSRALVCARCQTRFDEDEFGGPRPLRCPTCGARWLDPAAAPDDARDAAGSDRAVSGRPVLVLFGAPAPWPFGSASLRLDPTRIVEQTARPLTRRDAVLPLDRVETVELVARRNAVWLLLGLLTLPLYGLGLLFLLLFLTRRQRFLWIRGLGGTGLGVAFRGDETPYHRFLAGLLDALDNRLPLADRSRPH